MDNQTPNQPEQEKNEQLDADSAEFWGIIDTFIDLANDHVKAGKGDNVSAAMTYAAARFNAFIAATGASDVDSLKSQKAEAVDFFVDRYKNMLEDNIDEYVENYDDYTQNPEPDSTDTTPA